REVERAGVELKLRTTVTREILLEERPSSIIVATGSEPRLPKAEIGECIDVVHAVDIVTGRKKAGARVVVADWLADWIGVGVAEKLASEGSEVTLAVNGACPAVAIQNYVRDAAIARLHRLQVDMRPFM